MTDVVPDLTLAERIDALCDRFEQDFRDGNRPQIEACLGELPEPFRTNLLRAVVGLEIELRQKRGEKPQPEDYLSRFPSHTDAVHQAFTEVRSILSSVKVSTAETSKGPTTAQAVSSSDSQPLKHLGRFQILSVLGEGAFGTVYKAHDPQLDRDVAVKVPRFSALQNKEDRERFLREGRAAAGLHHPQICPVYEVGTIDGRDYIVMAFIDGKPLSKVLQTQTKLSEKQIVSVIRKIALALQEAHDKGVIHRDLKPANIMINRKGEPVIMDFGLARRSNSGDAQISQSGQIMGTPAYMSPEQARGDSKSVGPSADIYSLGVVFYEMLCGRRPFEGTITEVIGQILHVDAEPPSMHCPGIDPRLEEICLKSIAKKSADRFAAMKDFAAALANYVKTVSTVHPPAAKETAPAQDGALHTKQFAKLMAAVSSDLEDKVERAASRAVRKSRKSQQVKVPWWTYLVGSGLMGVIVLLGIFFFIRKDTVTVIVNIPIENINDPSLSFLLDNQPIAAEKFAAPIELKPGEHELLVNKDGKEFKRFLFNVGKSDNQPVIVQDMTREALTPEIVLERLQGRWVAVEQARGGAALTPDELKSENKVMTISKDRFSIEYQTVQDRSVNGIEAGRITRIDPSTSPAEIDMVFERGEAGPLPFKGIFELNDDRLIHCYRKCHESDCPRPTNFTTVKGEAVFYVEYVRATPADGWIDLFNGKDLTGWSPESGDTEHWKVQDGVIVGVADDAVPPKGAETWLLSDKEYQDFLLRFDFRAVTETVNSGFGYRVVPREKPGTYPVPTHLQVELFENPANRANQTLATGTLIGSLGPLLTIPANSSNSQKPRNEWNRMEVEVRGQSIRIRLNGSELVNSSLDDLIAKGATYPGLKRKTGRIALQRLRGTIHFRDIQIKELKSREDGFVSLFNGEDLAGWKTPLNDTPNPWKVENGVLNSDSTLPMSMIVTERNDYRDVHVRAEALFGGGRAGIKIRTPQDQDPHVASYTVAMYDQSPPPERGKCTSFKPPLNTWVTLELIIRGFHVKVMVNGKLIDEYDDTKQQRKSGHIGLARGPKTKISFRKIEVKELSSEVADSAPMGAGWIDLFNGKDLSNWVTVDGKTPQWKVEKGYMEVVPGMKSIVTGDNFPLDFELHAEFWVPKEPGKRDQGRGNSGIYLHGRHEIQICDGYQNPIAKPKTACGALFGEIAPTFNACTPPETWQTYDITYHSPRVEGNKAVITPGRLTVIHNGQKVINNEAFQSVTGAMWHNDKIGQPGPIMLQDHGSPVRFRNIRIRPLTATDVRATHIPADAQTFNGHSYKFFAEQLPWKAAKANCEALGGHLIIVDNAEENAFAAKLVAQAGWVDSWIGATDEAKEGDWRTVKGEPLTFINWFASQPNNKPPGEHWALMSNKDAGGAKIGWKWSDQPNDSKQHKPGYLCEWDAVRLASNDLNREFAEWVIRQHGLLWLKTADGRMVEEVRQSSLLPSEPFQVTQFFIDRSGTLDKSGFDLLEQLTGLTGFGIESNDLLDDDILRFSRMPLAKQVLSVDFHGNKLTDAGLERLAGWSKLEAVNFGKTQATWTTLDRLRGLKLKKLIPETTSFGDAALAHVPLFPDLEHIDLAGTKVTDEGLIHLTKLPRLQGLVLFQTAVTDDGLKALLNCSPTLRTLWLRETQVTANGVAAFRTARPEVTIDADVQAP